MIFLDRPPEPPALIRNKKAWTRRFQTRPHAAKSGWATKQAREVIGEALDRMAHGKCAFCEIRLGTGSYAAIEHYQPKSHFPELSFEWSNLFPVCQVCNTTKGSQLHGGALLKPDQDDAELFFSLDIDSGKLMPHPSLDPHQRRRAEETIRICNLNRGALCVSRRERLDEVSREIETIGSNLAHLLRPEREFKFVVRWRLERAGLKEIADLDRQVFRSR